MIWHPFCDEVFCVNSSKTEQTVLTLYSTLAVKFGTEHPHPEHQHHEGKEYPNTKADTPDRRKVVLSSDRKNDEEYGTSQRTTKLSRKQFVADT